MKDVDIPLMSDTSKDVLGVILRDILEGILGNISESGSRYHSASHLDGIIEGTSGSNLEGIQDNNPKDGSGSNLEGVLESIQEGISEGNQQDVS
ncbi:hypothetical protein ANO11243_081770 [Dothideomycetidae sp. 11243]|nr:hypothetical protein ANO11243_081770 [fungal sp. No.11243]